RLPRTTFHSPVASSIPDLPTDPSSPSKAGARNGRTLHTARRYIESGPAASHRRYGFGLCAVELKASAAVIGLCGLLRRDTHPDVEIGFALLPRFRHQGYALEAAQAVLRLGTQVLGLGRIVAITSPGNAASIRI